MPSTQRGSVLKREGGYGVRWYDENNKRRRRGGFGPGREGKAAADAWLRDKLVAIPSQPGRSRTAFSFRT
jgi:hypothetical protein